MAKATRGNKKGKPTRRRAWSKLDVKELRLHSKKKTAVAAISRTMNGTEGGLRQQALKLGIPLGHRR
jgi:hypothetical protein